MSQSQCGGIVGQVGRHPACCLIGRIPIATRPKPLTLARCPLSASCGINPPFGGLARGMRQVGYALLTRAPVANIVCKHTTCCPATCMC